MNRHDNRPEIQRADPDARRRALLLVGAVFAAGFPLVWLASRERDAWGRWLAEHVDVVREHSWMVAPAVLVALVPFLVFAVCMWRIGGRVIEAQRFPPPQHRVVRDTPVLVGERGIARGRALRALGLALIASCLAVAVLASLVVAALAR